MSDQEDKLGSVWEKGDYMSGVLELEGKDGPKINVVFFRAKNRKSAKSPNWYIFKSRPKEERQARDRSILDGGHSDAAGPGDDEIPF